MCPLLATVNGSPFDVPFAVVTTNSPLSHVLPICTVIFWYHIHVLGGDTITRHSAPFNVTVGEVRKFPYNVTYTPPLLEYLVSEFPVAGPAIRSVKNSTGAPAACCTTTEAVKLIPLIFAPFTVAFSLPGLKVYPAFPGVTV
jgi:hypothetical protein